MVIITHARSEQDQSQSSITLIHLSQNTLQSKYIIYQLWTFSKAGSKPLAASSANLNDNPFKILNSLITSEPNSTQLTIRTKTTHEIIYSIIKPQADKLKIAPAILPSTSTNITYNAIPELIIEPTLSSTSTTLRCTSNQHLRLIQNSTNSTQLSTIPYHKHQPQTLLPSIRHHRHQFQQIKTQPTPLSS